MRVRFSGAKVVLTGASSGIGWEMARQLAPRVASIALVARRESRLRELEELLRGQNAQLEVKVLPCDLTDRAAREQLCASIEEAWGCPDILINNAGYGDVGLFERADLARLLRMVELNVISVMDLTHRFVGKMVERGSGGILQVSSGFGLTWLPMFATYVGTKQFLTSFTECLRLEVRGKGVTVSQLCPGPVATEFEQVTGNPFGMSPPKLLELSAEQCARSALRGFEKGKAMILPGFFNRVLMFFTGMTPRWLHRWATGLSVSRFRKKQLAFEAAQADAQRKQTTSEGSPS